MRKTVGFNIYTNDLNQTASSVPAGGIFSMSCANVFNPVTGLGRDFNVTVINGPTAKSGAQMIDDLVNAFRAAPEFEVLRSTHSFTIIHAYPEEGPFPSLGITTNSGYVLSGAHLTMLGSHVARYNDQISALERSLSQSQLDLQSKDRIIAELQATSGGSAGAGSTVVSIEQPAEKDYASIALAALAGYGVGKMQNDSQYPKKKRK